MILLDTNALLWLHQRHRRARPLASAQRLFASPSTILELQILSESGRLRLRPGFTPATAVIDDRWAIDEVPATRWFTMADRDRLDARSIRSVDCGARSSPRLEGGDL